jgi:hypothetical protein
MAAQVINPGTNLNSVPTPAAVALASNYIDFTSDATKGWGQQYVPDLMAKEAEVFGNRSVSGFLEQVGAEEAMAADRVVWSEQGRLHLSYTGAVSGTGVITIAADIDGNSVDAAGEAGHGVREGDTVIVSKAGTSGATVKCYVSDVTGLAVTVLPYSFATLVTHANIAATDTVSLFVYGSEYKKGQDGRTGSNSPTFKSYSNKPIIMKDLFEVSGSDASQIGWVEVSGEEGQNGYLWYLKAAGDTKARFTDYCEMAMIESELKNATASSTVPVDGSEGLFAAITDRGNVSYGSTAFAMIDFDNILKEFDKQGAIEEYMMFLDRTMALQIDDMLAGLSIGTAGGTAYGVFDNDEDMALNLGFSGFRRGSYDFYKTDWKYLNDKSTRGGVVDAQVDAAGKGDIEGVFVPAGVSSVYDQNLGKNLKRPFLHVRYRASQADNRKFKTWTTGSVGATTSALDAMQMHMLTERCLVVQGANNFMMLRG